MLKKLSSAYKEKQLEGNITAAEINIFCKCDTKTTTAKEHILCLEFFSLNIFYELLFVAQPILLSQSRVVVPPRYVMQLKDMEAIF